MIPITLAITMAATASPVRLQTEFASAPISLDETPRFSWQIKTTERNWKQSAYQIRVAKTRSSLKSGKNLLWDSGEVADSRSRFITYSGPAFSSRDQGVWQVRVKDAAGAWSDWSAASTFEMGLLKPEDWSAKWISMPLPLVKDLERTNTPVAYLRRSFHLTKPVKQARLYGTALGVYRAFVNANRVSKDELSPGWTDYDKRLNYQTTDVTRWVRKGDNVLAAMLGSGWYCGYVGWGAHRDHYGKNPSLLLQLEVTYADGSREIVGTDDQWVGKTGPIVYDDLLSGESFDARIGLPDWHAPLTKQSDWKPITLVSSPKVALVSQVDEPVAVTQEFRPKKVTALPGGKWLVDMGQNMVGHVRLTVEAPAGQCIRMRFGEVLNPDGTLYTTNLRSALQTDTYVAKGEGTEVWEPTFTFHGFRYVEVDGFPGKATTKNFLGRVVGSPLAKTGTLKTGNKMVNQLISNIDWGLRGNFVSVPTDCPQRDERLGWMGDAQIFVQTASLFRGANAFYAKWLQDVADAQSAQGGFSDVSPRKIDDNDGAPAWGDAGVIVPWTVYRSFGDVRVLEKMYEPMAKWVEYIHKENPTGLWLNRRNNDFGDWLSIDADTPKEVLATAYYAYDCDIMTKTATVLGKKDDAVYYAKLAQTIKDEFTKEFVKTDGSVRGDTQTAYLLALHFNLVPAEVRPAIAKKLVENIKAKGNHLSTGFIGVGYLCPTLSEIDQDELAYKLLLNDTFPSWGYSITRGATTIWERWDGWTNEKGFQDPGMNSFNHYSLGSVGEWLFRYVAGIDFDESDPGFKTIVMRPRPSRTIGHADATFDSPYGQIKSEWHYEGSEWVWNVTVPANTIARIELPGATATENGETAIGHQVAGKLGLTRGSGTYSFRLKA